MSSFHLGFAHFAGATFLALFASGGSAQSLDQDFTLHGQKLTVPVACFDAELSYIVLTAENTASCSQLPMDLIDAFNFAVADDDPANNPVAVVNDDWGDEGPLTTGSVK